MKMMDDDNIGKEGPEHFTEHGDEEGEDSDSALWLRSLRKWEIGKISASGLIFLV